MPAGNHGSCINQNKYPVQENDYNYHDSVQARQEGIGHRYFITSILKSHNFSPEYRIW